MQSKEASFQGSNNQGQATEQVKEQQEKINLAEKEIVELKLQIGQLQQTIFGKGRGKKLDEVCLEPEPKPKPKTKPRTKESYRRRTPPPESITSTIVAKLPEHCSCGGTFKNVSVEERFEEDIPLPGLAKNYQSHLTTRLLIETGTCTVCRRTKTGRDQNGRTYSLSGQTTKLGKRIRLLAATLNTVCGLSHSKVIKLFDLLYQTKISSGEMSAIIKKQAKDWTTSHERLEKEVKSNRTISIDESPYPIQSENGRGHVWVMAPIEDQTAACFYFEKSRGAPIAQKLLGDRQSDQTRISDGFTAYYNQNLPGYHQFCWAHPHRKLYDLVSNRNIPAKQKPYTKKVYRQFCRIYSKLSKALSQPYDFKTRLKQKAELSLEIDKLIRSPPPATGQPKAITKIKNQLIKAGPDHLFNCLLLDIPCDNNRAERELRPIVLKRKSSFGCKTEKGAEALSVLFSLCTTTWRRRPNSYFQALSQLE